MHRWPPVQAFVVIGILQFILVAPDIPALAQQPALFSEDQVAQGRLDYSQHCASCHGTQLQNGGAPTLTGPWFVERWNGKTLGDFYDYVHQTMPLGEAASLTPALLMSTSSPSSSRRTVFRPARSR